MEFLSFDEIAFITNPNSNQLHFLYECITVHFNSIHISKFANQPSSKINTMIILFNFIKTNFLQPHFL